VTVADTAKFSVGAASRNKLLRLLVNGKGLDDAAVECGLPDSVAHQVASDAGWPNLAKVDVERRKPFRGVEVPAPRASEPEAPADPPESEPVVEDHPAVERALSLARLVRDKDPDQIARLTGAWSPVELLETALALAAMVPLGVEPEVALLWLDRPAGEWPPPVVAVEAGRWDAGARDRTALAGVEERARRG
jgi:hypothetical protein